MISPGGGKSGEHPQNIKQKGLQRLQKALQSNILGICVLFAHHCWPECGQNVEMRFVKCNFWFANLSDSVIVLSTIKANRVEEHNGSFHFISSSFLCFVFSPLSCSHTRDIAIRTFATRGNSQLSGRSLADTDNIFHCFKLADLKVQFEISESISFAEQYKRDWASGHFVSAVHAAKIILLPYNFEHIWVPFTTLMVRIPRQGSPPLWGCLPSTHYPGPPPRAAASLLPLGGPASSLPSSAPVSPTFDSGLYFAWWSLEQAMFHYNLGWLVAPMSTFTVDNAL